MAEPRVQAAGALPEAFYDRTAEEVARDLLGAVLVSTCGGRTVSGRIVETEAYVGPHDPASHAAERVGRTARNETMFAAPGTAYVYLSYGLHWCLNVVAGALGYPAAVLIRALEPLEGIAAARERRGDKCAQRDLMRGPGRLCQALGVTGELNGHKLFEPPLVIVAGEPVADGDVVTGPRVGISQARDWPLRYFVRDSRWVSRPGYGRARR